MCVCVTHTHRHPQLSFVADLQSRVRGNESAAAKEGLHTPTQPFHPGRKGTEPLLLKASWSCWATLIVAVPLLRNLEEREEKRLSFFPLCFPRNEPRGCNCNFDFSGTKQRATLSFSSCTSELFSGRDCLHEFREEWEQAVQCPKITSLSYFPWKYPVCVCASVCECEPVYLWVGLSDLVIFASMHVCACLSDYSCAIKPV